MTAFSALRRVSRAFVVVVLGVLVFAVTPAMAEFGIERFAFSARNQNGTPDVQAGSHPYSLTTTFVLNQPVCDGETCIAEGDPKDARVELPAGFVGDPNATPRCAYQQFINPNAGCSSDEAIGTATSYLGHERQAVSPPDVVPDTVAVFNLVPPPGVAAEFGFIVAGETPVLLQSSVRTGSDYGLTTAASDISQAILVYASKVTIWGVPASPAHNPLRGGCERVVGGDATPLETVGLGLREGEDELEGPIYPHEEEATGLPESNGVCSSEAPQVPLLTMPTSCGLPQTATLRVDDWTEPGNFTGPEGTRTRSVTLPPLGGCGKLEFSSSLSVKPEKGSASTPSGLVAELNVPQEGLESPTGLAASDVRDGTVVFPEGLQLNASAVNGLAACSTAQVGFTGFAELNKTGEPGVQTAQFTPRLENPVTGEEEATLCPAASRIGNVSIKSPLLEDELTGGIYLATPQNFIGGPQENPFNTLIAVYGVAEDPKTGVLVKFPAKLVANPVTGQLTGTVENAPQQPFSKLKFELYGGERASIATPAKCGTYATSLSLTPWAGGLPFSTSNGFEVTSGPSSGACPGTTLPFTPTLAAESTSTTAGGFTPLSTSLGREDGQQDLRSTSITFPPGVSAVLTGVPECGEAQANAGACPAGSEIGEDTASVGFGEDPYTVTGGKVYLTGPYDGAPFGLSIVTPAKAGPFVLQQGVPVVTRAKIEINPTTARVTVTTTGAIPRIIEGIPLEIKHVNVTVNRPSFTINPTSCEPMSITGTVGGWEGASSPVSSPFQVGSCANLAFKPTIAVAAAGKASKADGASLKFNIAYPKNAIGTQAWFREAKLVIPKQLPARLTTLQQACLQATFEKERAKCPVHSKIGTAIVHTPVLPVPLEGPVYFVSYGGAKFPNVVMALSGDGVNVELVGETLIKNNITSATFNNLPDVPFESVQVTIPAGEYSEFGSYVNAKHPYRLCGTKLKVPTLLKAQNGLEIKQETPVTITSCPKAKKHKHKKPTHHTKTKKTSRRH